MKPQDGMANGTSSARTTPHIHEQIRLAFWAAREKRKPDWWRMTTAVLKNRLLALTDRQFNEKDYGVQTIAEFASQFPDLLLVDTSTYPPEVELRPTHIRQDLWDAVMGARSGKTYVWDNLQRKVRESKEGDDVEKVVPTLKKEEVATWRAEFAERYKASLPPTEVASLDRWAHFKLRTESLPDRLRSLWNREQSWRVWERLSNWFVRFLPLAERPLLEEPLKASRASNKQSARFSKAVVSPPLPDDLAECRDSGNWLGVGEILCLRFSLAAEEELETLFAQTVIAWAAPIRPLAVSKIADVVRHIEEVDLEYLATAFINASYRLRKADRGPPSQISDIAFRLSGTIADAYGVTSHRHLAALCLAATTKLGTTRAELEAAVRSFQDTNTLTAKAISIDVLRAVHQYRPLAIAAERPYLREVDVILGSSFRKFCESCERHVGHDTIRRAEELRVQTARLSSDPSDPRLYSLLWTEIVRPIVSHVSDLVEQGTRQSEESNRPALALARGSLKLDLSTPGRSSTVSGKLINNGHGRAVRVDIGMEIEEVPTEIDLVEPKRPFDVAGNSTQVISFSVETSKSLKTISLPIKWICSDATGRSFTFNDELVLEQQRTEPDWGALLTNPPYTINPVRKRESLFGREAVLNRLLLHATSGTSTFLWGQKRVGKTSVLQVLASELEKIGNVVCIFLRMGELAALHEGQIAYTIASRVNDGCSTPLSIPNEEYFGAGLSRLVPFIDQLAGKNSQRLVVIVDEFDDLDAAFYTGERGHQFVKALRSLSEVGLTFFFVGSERMESIYRRHAIELNKWVNVSLDRIESLVDCRILVSHPVRGAIEYEDEAIELVVEYCAGNPFYMHLFCFEVFKRCVEERRTYVSSADVQVVRQHLLRSLGRTNFAHFWGDNPELSLAEQVKQTAENCLVLACVASIGGRYQDAQDVFDGQESLALNNAERMVQSAMAKTLERLRLRRVLTLSSKDGRTEVSLPIFRDWLAENAEELLPAWRDFIRRSDEMTDLLPTPTVTSDFGGTFPIPEDDLLAVSQRLIYCGKQKDVAEVRRWLRQFDDDSRIEVAFLLLRRLAESGYISEGAKVSTLNTVEEAVQDLRLRVGRKVWTIVRGRRDNLCITFVDSETKSGATTARELAKRIRPGKVADGENIETWLRAHIEEDPLLMIVDDFAGTGTTLETGLRRLIARLDKKVINQYLDEGRVSCLCQFAFPEAFQRLKSNFPKIHFNVAHVFGDELRALDPQANVFTSEEDRKYGHDVLLQIGRELTPQNPLGWGDMGSLVVFHNTVPNNTLPIFWSSGKVNDRPWQPLFPRA